MEWIERLNSAVNYMEENLTTGIDMDQVARIAGCSTYHFQRMFAYMADVPLSEYIRRRKMSLAAVELQDEEKRVLDVALKYGYESPTSFNRAFQSVHGVTPTQARKQGISIKAFPPISFKMIIKGDSEMNYRIEKKDAFRIVGVSAPLEKDIEKNFETVPKMWGEAVASGTLGKLASMMNTDIKGILGVSICGDDENWSYYISVATSLPIDESLQEYTVPACTWAIFSGTGTNVDMQILEKRIVTEWLPNSGYEYGKGPDVEVYLNPDPQNAIYEVWIPVVKKDK